MAAPPQAAPAPAPAPAAPTTKSDDIFGGPEEDIFGAKEDIFGSSPSPASYSPGETIQAMVGPSQFQPAQVLAVDAASGRVQVRYQNGFEVWLEPDQVKKG